jgi:hypothetical protein
MVIPAFSSESWAAILSALLGASIAGSFSWLGVRLTLRGERKNTDSRRSEELRAIRLALYMEIGTVAQQCLIEFRSRTRSHSRVVGPAYSLMLPPLTVYEAVAAKVGQLSRDEIIAIIGFAGCLWDIGVLAQASQSEAPPFPGTLTQVLSNACGLAADCLTSIPVDDSERDEGFIAALRGAAQACEEQRNEARQSIGLKKQV